MSPAAPLSGWGRYPQAECVIATPRRRDEILAAIAASPSLIARGNGRSYGDSSLNPETTLITRHVDRVLSFDAETGLLTCEAGLLLSDLLDLFLPLGWFPPVTPGTKFVSVGGMIASDVHGKNHHRAGSFGAHVISLDLALADGSVIRCGPAENRTLFEATCGGMGLTGVILRASFHLLPVETAQIRQETLRAANLDQVMDLFEASAGWTYSVAWIDCLATGSALGRSLLYRGEHAKRFELPKILRDAPIAAPPRPKGRVPMDFPAFLLNRYSVRAFNELYYRRARPGTELVDLESFFYPLDALLDWNRLYGKRGLVQYQCVLPKAASREGLGRLLERIARAGLGSFLAVLKLFGRQEGLLSFPMEGYSLALDFPATAPSFALLDELDAIVADHGGRLYLAKDARMSAPMMRGYDGLDRFREIRREADPAEKFSSLQSERLVL